MMWHAACFQISYPVLHCCTSAQEMEQQDDYGDELIDARYESIERDAAANRVPCPASPLASTHPSERGAQHCAALHCTARHGLARQGLARQAWHTIMHAQCTAALHCAARWRKHAWQHARNPQSTCAHNRRARRECATHARRVHTCARMQWKEDPNTAIRDARDLLFSDRPRAIKLYGQISEWDTSSMTDFSELFKDKSAFNEDISRWNTRKVGTFMNCAHLLARRHCTAPHGAEPRTYLRPDGKHGHCARTPHTL